MTKHVHEFGRGAIAIFNSSGLRVLWQCGLFFLEREFHVRNVNQEVSRVMLL